MRKSGVAVCLTALLVLAAAVAGADGYRVTVGVPPDEVPVVVVSGTPYEMGFAMGRLLKDDCQAVVQTFMGICQAEGSEQYSNESLDKAWDTMKPYISERFVEELRGVADGAEIPLEMVRRAHMIPAVGDASCSGVAMWGTATRNQHLYQLRNLDYITEAGLQDHPAVVIYIPKEGVPHANVTFAGVIGVNTGMNAEGIALSEIGDAPHEDYPFDLNGIHFMMMFRDILYDAHSLDEAVTMIKDAKRIKKYHYVVGDGQDKQAVKMRAHAPDLDIWKDNDPTDELAPRIFKNIVYHAEGRDPIAVAHLTKYQGDYDADAMIHLSKSIASLGSNLLDAVYDATSLELWVAYAEKEECAYRRPFVHINMNDYLDPTKVPAGAVRLNTK